MGSLALLSLMISIIYTEITNLIPGGMILPYYFLLNFEEPVKIAATLVTALISMVMVRLLSDHMILYGRRRFVVYIACGILLKMLFSLGYAGNLYMMSRLSLTIGYLVPGILGRNMEKQGILPTLGALTFTTVLGRLFQILLLR